MSPEQSPGGTNLESLLDYSASKTGLKHLKKETMITVADEIKKELNSLRLPAYLSLALEKEGEEGGGKLGSLTTIFSIWNTMVGSGLLFIPWAYSNSGLVLGILITLVSFLISYYTCYLVLKTAGTDNDYTDTLQKYFGRVGWTVGMGLFIVNLFVPIIIYF